MLEYFGFYNTTPPEPVGQRADRQSKPDQDAAPSGPRERVKRNDLATAIVYRSEPE